MKLACQIIQCAGLISLAAASAFSQTPTSGAVLTINGSVGSVSVIRNIYDSQIHTGTVITVGTNCGTGDAAYKTDAYVLQGGSPTGCDPGDPFETSQGTGTATISGTGYSFTVTTVYTYGPKCNTNGNICVGTAGGGPDTGFLTITNNSGSFVGTITLSGTSAISGAPWCPPSGNALDTFTGTLAATQSWTGALSVDSSNCGGFNADQKLTITAGSTTKFPFGNDAYEITPFNSAPGDQLVVRPVPVPQNLFILPPSSPFLGQNCIPYADTSAPLGAIGGPNPVCLELQVTCPSSGCSDSGNFLYQAQADYTIDPVSLPNGIGGPAFLGQHSVPCPTVGFNLNIFLSYTADPTKGTGGGTGSCYVATYSPTTPTVAPGGTVTQQTFVGFQAPVVNCSAVPCVRQSIQAGSAIPEKWQTLDLSGQPVTDLNLCTDNTFASCTGHWVFAGYQFLSCANDASSSSILDDNLAGNSGLQNLAGGNYQVNWKTQKSFKGSCATPVFVFYTGFYSFDVAEFQFK